jgi:hypothetical protein
VDQIDIKKVLLPIIVIVLGASFYWLSYRPEQIRSGCAQMVASRATYGTSMDAIQRLQRLCEDAGGRTAFEQALAARAVDQVAEEPIPTETPVAEEAAPETTPQTLSSEPTGFPPPLADYQGKYPWQEVGGFSVIEHPRIRAALDGLSLAPEVKNFIRDKDVVASPIEVNQWYVIASGCEPHNCTGKNWKLEYHMPENVVRVCYYDEEGPSSLNRWYADGDPVGEGSCR